MSPPEREKPAPSQRRPSLNCTNANDNTAHRRQDGCSQQVSWWSVREFIAPVLNQVNDWPTLGTPAWCSLAHDDPRKWAALLDGAQHWALRVETCQAAMAEASRDISTAADWPAIARETRQRNEFYAQRPHLKRVAS
jgi:hypothetical protein